MAKPATTFTFATNTVNNGTFNTPNKKAPSATKLEDGFLVETLHRGELNYLFNQIGEWITYLADDVNGEKIEFGTSKVEIPVIDGDILSTRNNVLKQRITSNTTDFLNDIRTESISGDNHFSVNKETGEITAPLLTGNAGSATKLKTARNIELKGDVTGSVSFDGTGDVAITATVEDGSHNHSGNEITSGTVAADRIANLPASKITSGTFSSARIPTATETTIGGVEEATSAEMEAGSGGKFPDCATIKGYFGTTETSTSSGGSNNISNSEVNFVRQGSIVSVAGFVFISPGSPTTPQTSAGFVPSFAVGGMKQFVVYASSVGILELTINSVGALIFRLRDWTGSLVNPSTYQFDFNFSYNIYDYN